MSLNRGIFPKRKDKCQMISHHLQLFPYCQALWSHEIYHASCFAFGFIKTWLPNRFLRPQHIPKPTRVTLFKECHSSFCEKLFLTANKWVPARIRVNKELVRKHSLKLVKRRAHQLIVKLVSVRLLHALKAAKRHIKILKASQKVARRNTSSPTS